ncbi:murein tripeptide amidase MpaA [Pelagicoccus enzymogenes]|uniref:murein tripeptide amidase MpaA n=1 Tax=Pelagicoccus enzymogenes TaxID=2773457 RepID=UPI00280EDB48|nr:murein tripeptide amidase MpaA [Pelagicoccus enzymogenes]MDQ8198843.1 murein tripeptide amidase MpaA [Pelagicoccus enzymogenes]
MPLLHAIPRPRSIDLAGNLLAGRTMLTCQIHLYTLELKQAWAIASRLGPGGRGIGHRSSLLLKLSDRSGATGFGEAAPVATYGETALSVLRFLRELDWQQLSFRDLPRSLAYLGSLPAGNSAAKAAIDLALHDGAAKISRKSLAELLGLPFRQEELPPTSYSIGIGSPDEIVERALDADRFPILKLKVDARSFETSLSALRSVSPNKPVRIDANESWSSREAALDAIDKMAAFGPIEFVEQPMPRGIALEDAVWLKRHSPLPLLADESCCGKDDLDACEQSFHGINVKIAKAGGIAPAHQLATAARARGLKVQLGCMIESSLGIAAALQLAAKADWIDLDGALLTRNDPIKGVVEKSGQLNFDPLVEPYGLRVSPKFDYWNEQPPLPKPIADRSRTPPAHSTYGRSVNGIPLEVHLPSSGHCEILIFAAIHGEEPETTTLLSKALRSLDKPSPTCAAVLCSNPDGTLLGTRVNANGVELNRNFPASNWQPDPVSTKWAPNHGYVTHSTGSQAASEPETRALISLVEALDPKVIISLHAPLACIEDPEYSPIGYWLSKRTGLPLFSHIGYETPGSFGSWAKERGRHVITYELPPLSVSALHHKHLDNLVELLCYGLEVYREPLVFRA